MTTLKPSIGRRSTKNDRIYKVLLGLVSHYLKTGKPVGSNTLKDAGFEDLSSATIRNYFAQLEQEGFLSQQHTSGGRIPTPQAYRHYAQENLEFNTVAPREKEKLEALRQGETREIAAYLQKAAETLSSLTNTAVFLSAPRFDHDYIIDLKLVSIDHHRCLCIIITDFGVVQTEMIHLDHKLTAFAVKRIEGYFHWRLTGHNKPENFEKEEEELAQKIYNEVMVRYIVGYSNFIDAEIYRTGFSRLLSYPDFHDATLLANSLALFENTQSMRHLVKECCKAQHLKFWIGDDLKSHATSPDCSVIAIPYFINQNIVGVVGLLGPIRMPYPQFFALMREFSNSISEALTKSIFKFKIAFRQPHVGTEHRLIKQTDLMLLENKTV